MHSCLKPTRDIPYARPPQPAKSSALNILAFISEIERKHWPTRCLFQKPFHRPANQPSGLDALSFRDAIQLSLLPTRQSRRDPLRVSTVFAHWLSAAFRGVPRQGFYFALDWWFAQGCPPQSIQPPENSVESRAVPA
jgi:hypothetical protein